MSTELSGTVTCPGCKKKVTPTLGEHPPGGTPTDSEGTPSGRWSFVWRPPTGEQCPECGFALERYLKRRPWIMTLRVGVSLVTAAILAELAVVFELLPSAVSPGAKGAGAVGAVVLLVGLAGMVVGGRSTPVAGR